MLWLPFRTAFNNPIFRAGLQQLTGSSMLLTYSINYLIALSVLLILTWPKDNFLRFTDVPVTYMALGSLVLIILAYLNLSWGGRKSLGSEHICLHDWLKFGPVPKGTFLRGYLAAGLLDTIFFWGLSLPLLTVAARVTGASLSDLAAGLLVILTCLGSYRTVGIALLTIFEQHEFFLYLLLRMIYLFFILVSGFVVPWLNPILAFVDTTGWSGQLGSITLPGLTLPGWVGTVGLHLLIAAVAIKGMYTTVWR